MKTTEKMKSNFLKRNCRLPFFNLGRNFNRNIYFVLIKSLFLPEYPETACPLFGALNMRV